MKWRIGKCLLLGIVLLLCAFFAFNFYILNRLNGDEFGESVLEQDVHKLIINNVKHLDHRFWKANSDHDEIYQKLNNMFNGQRMLWTKSPAALWKLANLWPDENRIYPLYEPLVGEVIRSIQEADIQQVDTSPKGTQLKLQILLAGGNQSVVFKPKWYERDTVIPGSVYSGKDRFNSEIFAFYLAVLLQLNWTPIAVGRKFNAKELYSLASTRLRNTFLNNATSYCFYGLCHYCDRDNLVCGHKHTNYEVEGVLLYSIPGQFAKKRSPWQRTYKDGVQAEWETNPNYCTSHVRGKLASEQLLLDLIDGALFDFLIQNGDRHHYETRSGRLLLIDNGKGFGNPQADFLDILAPLYQCCIMRASTYQRLLLFTGGMLSKTVQKLSKLDISDPILTQSHYNAVERRLILLLSAIDICSRKKGQEMFIS